MKQRSTLYYITSSLHCSFIQNIPQGCSLLMFICYPVNNKKDCVYITQLPSDHCLAATGNLKWKQKFTTSNTKTGSQTALSTRFKWDRGTGPYTRDHTETRNATTGRTEHLLAGNTWLLHRIMEGLRLAGNCGSHPGQPSSLKTRFSTAGCSGLSPLRFWITLRWEILQPPWATCSSLCSCLQQKVF